MDFLWVLTTHLFLLHFPSLVSLIFKKFIIFLAVLGLHSCVGFSLVLVSRGHSLAVVHRPLTSVVSLVEEHGL